MAKAKDEPDNGSTHGGRKSGAKDHVRLKDLSVSCMLNTEVGALLAVIRRPLAEYAMATAQFPQGPDDVADNQMVVSLKSLRSLIFQPRNEWRSIDPMMYLSPFLDVIQSDDVPVAATALALSAVLKILRLEIFDERTPGAREAVHSVVLGVTNSRLERTDVASEDAVLMRVLQVLLAVMRCRASILLGDHAVCSIVNTCFQVVQQSAFRGDALQKSARHTMHELVQLVFSQLPRVRTPGDEEVEIYADDGQMQPSYGAICMADIFAFMCSLLNVVVEIADGLGPISWDEDVQLFALILINSAIELGGEAIGRHPRLLWIIQDELFHYLIYYGVRSSPLFLSMICSTVLNMYNFLRRCLRLQLEAFFKLVLLRIASAAPMGSSLQEVAIEGIISFCRQPMFVIEMFVNYDCDPMCSNVFEEMGKLLCKTAFPNGGPFSPVQAQAIQGIVSAIATVADNIEAVDTDETTTTRESYKIEITEHINFWLKDNDPGTSDEEDLNSWVLWQRKRKQMKKRVMLAANHYNRDDKKGVEYLRHAHLVADPPDAKGIAYFFRYTPGLDKTKIGEYLGDPDEFNIRVLKEYTDTFDFSGVILDTALRTYLETFRLPGESQKIQRILEAFSDRFYELRSSDLFASKDAVLILCYSLIMLNTDQHNPQVKKKMTEDEFIRNNRAINGGKDLPREYLSELFRSISTNAFALPAGSGGVVAAAAAKAAADVMNPTRWVDLLKRALIMEPYLILDSYEPTLSRDLFVSISGPSVACLAAIFEQAEDEETLQESMRGLLSVARIAHFGLEDILDELLTCFCKFTGLLNPYAAPEELLFTFGHDLKPRLATLALFTICNKYGDAIRGGWRSMVECLVKLKKLKLLPASIVELPSSSENAPSSSTPHQSSPLPSKPDSASGVIFPWSSSSSHPRGSTRQSGVGLMGQFSQFLSQESGSGGDSMLSIGTETENNVKLIQQCQIGTIFTGSTRLPEDSLRNLGRALIFVAAGKNHRFSTPVEEEETVQFCWELLAVISVANLHRFSTFWPYFHENFNVVGQTCSPNPFSEKAVLNMFDIIIKILESAKSAGGPDTNSRISEELLMKSINMLAMLDKEMMDTCCEEITAHITQIVTDYGGVQTNYGWRSILAIMITSGRHPETYDQSVEAITTLLSDSKYATRYTYQALMDVAFHFAALRFSPLPNSLKILDLIANSVSWLITWHKSPSNSDPGSNPLSLSASTASQEMMENKFLPFNLFGKLIEKLRLFCLSRREEIRNRAVEALRDSLVVFVEEMEMTPSNCISCFGVILAGTDDLLEKTVEYSRRENSERETRSMEGTLGKNLEMLVDVFLRFLPTMRASSGFRNFWLGVLRRFDACMKADFGDEDGEGLLQRLVPDLLRRMILEMKAMEVLVQDEGNELWDITNIQIQWIAPQLKDELFPEEF